MKYATFNRFELPIQEQAVADCAHQGACDDDVAYWSTRVARPDAITPELLADELREYGAWDEIDLADDGANWERLLWLAASAIQEEEREREREEWEAEHPTVSDRTYGDFQD